MNQRSAIREPSAEDRAINEVVGRLAEEFPQASPEEVARIVGQSRHEFDDVPIRDFIPLLLERDARAQLRLQDAQLNRSAPGKR